MASLSDPGNNNRVPALRPAPGSHCAAPWLPPMAATVPVVAAEPASEYASFASILGLLWRHKTTLAGFVLGGLLLGIVLAATQQRTYQAKASLEVQMPNEDYLNRRQLNPVTEPGVILLEPFLQTQARLIQSETILVRVIEKLGLVKSPEFNPAPGLFDRTVRKWMGSARREGAPASRDLLEEVRRGLGVRLAGQTQIIEISFEASSPKLAADIVNAVAEEYRSQTLSRLVASTTQTARLLSTEIGDLESGVNEAEKRLRAFVASNGMLIGDKKESFAESKMRQTQSALGVAREARVAEQSHYEMVRNASPDALAKTLDSETLRAYRVKLTELRQKLAEESEVLKPAHYKIRQLKAEIAEVEESFERERTGILARLKSQYEAARFRESSLQTDYDHQAGLVSSSMDRSIQYDALKADLDTRRKLYDNMLQRVKDAGVVSAIQASNVRVVDPAYPPEKPIKPNKVLYGALGLTSGVFGGLLFLFVKEQQKGGASPRPIQAHPSLDVPHLGSIPRLASSPLFDGRTLEPVEGAEMAAGPASEESARLELAAWSRIGSPAAESFRRILPNLLYTTRAASRPRLIAVTSPARGDGRTVAATNLAIALAQSGRSVLLVDGDQVNPRLHKIFRLPNEDGLVDLVEGPTGGEHPDVVWMTDVPGLCVMPGGSRIRRLAGLTEDRRLPMLLDRLTRDFDIVLMDTPPLFGHANDGGLLAQHADGVVLVVHAGHTSPDLLDAALRHCHDRGLQVIGKIVNYAEPPAPFALHNRA
jgi:polysaccharide biosynthesis transport protein